MEPQEMGMFSGLHFLVAVFVGIIFLIPYVKIITKAGYSGWWILTIFVPLLNLIMLWVFAFASWPVERGARRDDGFVD